MSSKATKQVIVLEGLADNHTTLAGGDVVRKVEREGTKVSEGTKLRAIIVSAEGLARIFDENLSIARGRNIDYISLHTAIAWSLAWSMRTYQALSIDNAHNVAHVAHVTKNMHQDHGRGILGDLTLHICYILKKSTKNVVESKNKKINK